MYEYNDRISNSFYITIFFSFICISTVLLQSSKTKNKKKDSYYYLLNVIGSVKSHKLLGTYTVNYFQTHVILCSVDTLHEFTVLGWYGSCNVAWSRSKWFICLHVRLFFFVYSKKKKKNTSFCMTSQTLAITRTFKFPRDFNLWYCWVFFF